MLQKSKKWLCLLVAIIIFICLAPTAFSAELPPEELAGGGDGASPEMVGENPLDGWTGETALPGYESLDFGGQRFVIAAREGWMESFPNEKEIYSENSDAVSVAVRQRNSIVESTYNCHIELVSTDSPSALAAADIASNMHTIDLFSTQYSFKKSSLTYNIANLDVDFSKPWWDQAYLESYMLKRIDGSDCLYYIIGDFGLTQYECVHALAFNKSVYEAANIEEDIYDLVKNKKWTMDVFVEMLQKANVNRNANSQISYADGDTLGWATTNYTPHALHTASGLSMIRTTNGVMQDAMMDNAAAWIDAIDKAISVWSTEGVESIGYGRIPEAMRENRALFISDLLGSILNGLSQSSASFGLVPFPLHSEAQEDYAQYVDSHVAAYAVPTSVTCLDEIADFLEVFAAHSRYIVREVWIDTAVHEYFRDENSADMLEIVLNTKTYDPGYHSFSSVEADFSSMITSGQNNFSRWISRSGAFTSAKIQEYYSGLGCSGELGFALNGDGESYSVVCVGDSLGTGVVIPSTYNDKPVTRIGDRAFYNSRNLTSIEIPANVTSIGDSAFNGCTNLTSVTIPDSVTSIGDSAFNGCTNLTSVTIPDSVTSIGSSAFNGCSSITSIDIPTNVTNIGYSAFYGCRSLTSITVAENNPNYCSVEGVLFNKGKTEIICYPAGKTGTTYSIPNTVTRIGDYAFYFCSSLTSIEIPEGVTSIGYGAFDNSSSLTSIDIPASVTSIGDEAFYGCTGLTSVTIPNSVASLGIYAFAYCDNLESITFGANSRLTSIGSSVFENCAGLTSIEIPDGVTGIGAYAFRYCTGLTSIMVPESVTSIGGSAFSGCSSLADITILNSDCSIVLSGAIPRTTKIHGYAGSTAEAYATVNGNAFVEIGEHSKGLTYTLNDGDASYSVTGIGTCTDTDIVIPSIYRGKPVKSIYPYAFQNCAGLTSVTIPDGVTSIGDYAFNGCTNLTSVTIPDSVTSIGDYAFNGCTGLTSVAIPDSVTRIAQYAFNGCTNLIQTENGVQYVDKWAIGYTSVTEATLRANTVGIADYAFYYLTSLTGIAIPNSVTSIGYSAFSYCTGLTSIEIPASVTSIGGYAFAYCSNLESITFGANSSLASIDRNAFMGCTGLLSIEIPDGVTSLGAYVFTNCTGLTSIKIPDSVIFIGRSAFGTSPELTYNEYDNGMYLGNDANLYTALVKVGNNEISSIEVPLSTKVVVEGAFNGCNNLTTITAAEENPNISSVDGVLFNKDRTVLIAYPAGKIETEYSIPNSVTSIGGYAFSGCTNLTSVTIPDSVTSIGDYAFNGCTNLTSVTIPDSVTSIGDYAFNGCTGLTSVAIPNSVTSIGEFAFDKCTGLTAVHISDLKAWCAIAFSGNSSNPLSYANHLYLNGIEIKNLVVPDSVTRIGSYAFNGCSGLKTITIRNADCTIASNSILKTIKIIGYTDSTADTYARANGNLFESLNVTGFVIGATRTGSDTFNVRIARSGADLAIDETYYLHATNERAGYEGQWVIDEEVWSNLYWVTATAYTYDTVPWGKLYAMRYTNSVGPNHGVNCRRDLISNVDTATFTREFTPKFTEGIHNSLNGATAAGHVAWTVGADNIVIDQNGKQVYFQKRTEKRFGVAGVYETKVRVSASALFDYDNYAVYKAIFDQASLIDPSVSNDTRSYGSSIVKGSDLIYVTVYEDSDYKYLKAGDTTKGSACVLLPYGKVDAFATKNGINTKSATGQADVLYVVTGEGYDAPTAMESWMINESECEIVSPSMVENTMQIDSENNTFTADYTVTIGCRPYYLRKYNNSKFTYECRFEEVKCLQVTGTGSVGSDDVVYDYDNAITIASYNNMDDETLFTYYKGQDGKGLVKKADSLHLTLADPSMDGWVEGLYTMVYNGRTYQIASDATVIVVTPSSSGFSIQEVTVAEAASTGVFVTSANFTSDLGDVASIAVIGEVLNPNSDYSTGLSYALNSDGNSYSVTGIGTCMDTDIVIPPTYLGKPVTSIGDWAFQNCRSLTSIEIPAGVTSIGNSAFAYCSSLASVEIPEGVTSIGNSAFAYCSRLTSIEIPASVTSIGNSAFDGCSSLLSIEMPASVTSIGSSAFSGCSSLTSITVTESNPNYCSVDGVLFIKDKTEIICYPAGKTGTTYSIPNTVTSIGNSAFDGCSSLLSIEIPEGVTSIGYSAFRNCRSLLSIEIPEGVTSIGGYAFDNCTNLIQTESGVRYVDKWVIGCSDIVTEVTLRANTKGIGDYAFSYCSSLTSIEIPEGVTSIGDFAFRNCRSLLSIEIPEGVTSIGNDAFNGCSSLTSIEIPASVTSIGEYAFYGCSGLLSIEIPEGVTSIGHFAFNGCSSLTDITILNRDCSIGTPRIPQATIIHGYAGSTAEAYATANRNPFVAIADVHYSEGLAYTLNGDGESYSVTGIGTCTDTDIVIPPTYNGKPVTSIGYRAFSGCSSLTSIEIPAGVTSIGEWAFQNCRSLTSVEIPEVVTSIGDYAFYYCSSLTSVTIPNGVTSIGGYAFSYCSSLTSIMVAENNQNYCSVDGVLFNKDKSTIICYPAGKTNASYTIPSSVTSIGGYAFYYCSSLTSITFAEGSKLTSIGGSAFAYCNSLTSINIPDSVTSIGVNAFGGCSSLTSIEIPEGVTSIGDYAFYYCSSLADITILSRDCGIDANVQIPQATTIHGYAGSTAEAYATANENPFVVIEESIPTPSTDVTVNGMVARPGDTVDVTISLAEATSLKTIGISNISYDSEKLELLNGTWCVEGGILSAWDAERCNAAFSATSNITAEGAIFKLTFRVKDDIEDCDVNVTCDVTIKRMDGGVEVALPVTVTGGMISVRNVLLGDMNGDGQVNSDDAVYLLFYTLFGDEEYPLTQNADINGDGQVNSNDPVHLLFHTLFPDQYMLVSQPYEERKRS